MIPILQFDPSSMSIWYDAHLISRMKGAKDIGQVLDLALRDDPTLSDVVPKIEDEWVKIRAGTIAAAVWHEKRHFLDFALTNYGAFRVRQFFLTYLSVPGILYDARETGELLVPLQSYLDKTFCSAMGVKEPTELVLQTARNVTQRKRIISMDRRKVQSRFGSREIGGEAIIEALAHHSEVVKSQMYFDMDLVEKIRADLPDQELVTERYRWLYEILHMAGLISSQERSDERQSILATPLVPICYAALACRVWGQKQTSSEGVYSYLPGHRLASLVPVLREQAAELLTLSVVPCWHRINDICKQVFGRSALEEMRTDIELEANLLVKLKSEDNNARIVSAYEDYHTLREQLFTELCERPENILADLEYSLSFAPKVQPAIVVSASAGEFGKPPKDYERLLGYIEPDSAENDDSSRWWWAAISKEWPQIEDKTVFCLRDKRAWIDIISDVGPLSKLLMDGRKIRTMLGPELIATEMRLKAKYGINIKVDPRYAYPRSPVTIENMYYLTGKDRFRCELTFVEIQKPSGVVIDPWMLRLWPMLIEIIMGQLVDREHMQRVFWRDWSPWILSDEFRDLLQDASHDPSLFVGLSW